MAAMTQRIGGPRFRVWPPVAVAVPWLLGFAVERAWGRVPDPSDPVEWTVRGAGWLLIVAFVIWNGWCLRLFVGRRTGLLPGQSTTALLTAGPYRWSRNPLYVGLLACYLGAALAALSVGALALLGVAWAGLHWGAVLPEERYLRARLGDPYTEYAAGVPRWL